MSDRPRPSEPDRSAQESTSGKVPEQENPSPTDVESQESPEASGRLSGPVGALGSASIFCDVCAETTPHRILDLDRRRPGPSASVSGLARCRRCRFTHRFADLPPKLPVLRVIDSDGPRSASRRVPWTGAPIVAIGDRWTEADRTVVVRRIERRSGDSPQSANVADIATLWVSSGSDPSVPLSIIVGRHTSSARLPTEPDRLFGIGDQIDWPGGPLTVTAFRARARTWSRAGDRFPAREIERLYARRATTPPAGKSDWSSDRSIPSSRASSTSTRERSRSSPGASRYRRTPRVRSARGGATDHRSRP